MEDPPKRRVISTEGAPKRREITPQEIEVVIRQDEERLKTFPGEKAKQIKQLIAEKKQIVARMHKGEVKIYQHIPVGEG